MQYIIFAPLINKTSLFAGNVRAYKLLTLANYKFANNNYKNEKMNNKINTNETSFCVTPGFMRVVNLKRYKLR